MTWITAEAVKKFVSEKEIKEAITKLGELLEPLEPANVRDLLQASMCGGRMTLMRADIEGTAYEFNDCATTPQEVMQDKPKWAVPHQDVQSLEDQGLIFDAKHQCVHNMTPLGKAVLEHLNHSLHFAPRFGLRPRSPFATQPS